MIDRFNCLEVFTLHAVKYLTMSAKDNWVRRHETDTSLCFYVSDKHRKTRDRTQMKRVEDSKL